MIWITEKTESYLKLEFKPIYSESPITEYSSIKQVVSDLEMSNLQAVVDKEGFWRIGDYMLTDYGYDGLQELYEKKNTKCWHRKNRDLLSRAFTSMRKEVEQAKKEIEELALELKRKISQYPILERYRIYTELNQQINERKEYGNQ